MIWLLVGLGCTDRKADEPSDSDSVVTFEFSLGADTAVAGEPVPFTAQVVVDGEPSALQPTITSDIDPALTVASSELTTEKAGTHALTVTLDAEGLTHEEVHSLDVVAGLAALLSLDVPSPVVAGDTVAATISGTDTFGNPTAADDAALTVSPSGVLVSGLELATSVAGTYTVTAALGDATADAPLVVVAGSAASIDLTFAHPSALGETVTASALVLDAHGNETDAAWSLEVKGTSPTTTKGHDVTFHEEGIYEVMASLDHTPSITDTEGPFTLDVSAPDLVVIEPSRASWVASAPIAVSGTVSDTWSDVATLAVNSTPTSMKGSSFATEVTGTDGLVVVETTAQDTGAHQTRDVRGVVLGDALAFHHGAEAGVAVRVGQGGLDLLASEGASFLTPSALEAMLPSPVLDVEEETCVWSWCFTTYAITLWLEDTRFDRTTLELDPRDDGLLEATLTVHDLEVDWVADGVLAEVSMDAEGTIAADELVIELVLDLDVTYGQVSATVVDSDVTAVGFAFDMDGWVYDVVDFFGIDVEGMVREELEVAVEDAARDEIPALVEDALAGFAFEQEIDLGGATVGVYAWLGALAVDGDGLTAELATIAIPDTWFPGRSGPGVLYLHPDTIAWRTGWLLDADLGVAVSLDLFNQVLAAAWQSGALDVALDADDLGSKAGAVALLAPGVTDPVITLTPTLAPFVVPDPTGDAHAVLQWGELELAIYEGVIDPGALVLRAWLFMEAPVEVSTDGTAVVPTLGAASVRADVVLTPSTESTSEALLEFAAPSLLPGMADFLGTIPLPALPGMTFGAVDLDTVGSEGKAIAVAGALVP